MEAGARPERGAKLREMPRSLFARRRELTRTSTRRTSVSALCDGAPRDPWLLFAFSRLASLAIIVRDLPLGHFPPAL